MPGTHDAVHGDETPSEDRARRQWPAPPRVRPRRRSPMHAGHVVLGGAPQKSSLVRAKGTPVARLSDDPRSSRATRDVGQKGSVSDGKDDQ